MKVALISDVHANLPALEAVLEHARTEGAEEVWNAGDFVGYGPFPEETIQRIRNDKVKSVIGNYDQKVLQVPKKRDEWRKTKPVEKVLAFCWAHDRLSKDSRDYLRALNQEMRMNVLGAKILLVHASPLSSKEHLGPDTPASRLRALAKAAKADIIVCGHSHSPFVLELDGFHFVNPGSVGRPDDGDPRASYAILKLKARGIQVKHHRVPYDVDKVVDEVRRNSLPESFAQMFVKGLAWAGLKEELSNPAPRDDEGTLDSKSCREAASRLGESLNFERGHARHVTRLALSIFDQMGEVHGLGLRERVWLETGALLHDIGWIEGMRAHHKTSFRLIQAADLSPMTDRDKFMAALIARFHRKALPGPNVEDFAALPAETRQSVCLLAGILRVADGLDRTHLELVRSVSVENARDSLTFHCAVSGDARSECEMALRKGNVLQDALQKNLAFKCSSL